MFLTVREKMRQSSVIINNNTERRDSKIVASGLSFLGMVLRNLPQKNRMIFWILTMTITFTYGGRNALIYMILTRIWFILNSQFIVGSRNFLCFCFWAHYT